MDWIKCSDRMPPLDRPVLACTAAGVVQNAVYFFNGEVWQDWHENWDALEEPGGEPFSHWMPMPDSPTI